MPSQPLPVISLAPDTYAKFNACVHCGLCLPACPTYVETCDEADSPRGRIHLMKAAVDGRINPSDVVFEHLDRCLVCRACETACPAGVDYHALLEAVRPQIAHAALGEENRLRSRILQWTIRHVLPFPNRASAAMGLMNLGRKLGLSSRIERLAPGATAVADAVAASKDHAQLPAFTPAVGGERGRKGSVILLRGCVGSVVSPGINAACAQVLSRNGFDVRILEEESCCGSLAAHANDPESAEQFAAALVDTLSKQQANYFVSPIAGCGAQLKALGSVLSGSARYAEKARGVAARMRDVSQLLVETGLQPPVKKIERRVTYHDPCHLAHAQRITSAPRQILAAIPGLQIVPLTESDMCCGAAGTYNMNQPELAGQLGQRKVRYILATGAAELITANIGCALQIARHLKAAGKEIPIRHVVEILAEAYDL
jgi:glycolate oxidase iron-sulfur subunit